MAGEVVDTITQTRNIPYLLDKFLATNTSLKNVTVKVWFTAILPT